jgi:two-component system OmpR family sensor kinase
VRLRLRLTFAYLVLLTVSLVAFSLAVYIATANRVSDSVDEKLRLKSEAIVTSLEPIDPPLSSQTIRANQRLRLDEEASSGFLFQVRNLAGSVVYSSFPSGSLNLALPNMVTSDGLTFATADVGGERFRIQYLPITSNGEMLGSLVIAQSLKDKSDWLSQTRTILIFGAVAVLLITNVPAYLVARRVLEPVRAVSRLARDIEQTADFSRRVRASAAGDEMAELIATFNSMIERVERTLETQKAFLADSSHELRRPLTVLRTDIDILRKPGLSKEQHGACLEQMVTQVEAISHLLSDLLLLSREGHQELVLAPVDYSAVCEQAMARLWAQDDRHEVTAKIAASVRVQGDEKRLAQMVWNLLENSVQYTPEGGRIEVLLQPADGLARLEVRDHGIGISGEDLPHIFDRFYRARGARDARTEGSGLGLAIVKYIVEGHNGSINVTSQPGEGTAFVVALPLAAASDS